MHEIENRETKTVNNLQTRRKPTPDCRSGAKSINQLSPTRKVVGKAWRDVVSVQRGWHLKSYTTSVQARRAKPASISYLEKGQISILYPFFGLSTIDVLSRVIKWGLNYFERDECPHFSTLRRQSRSAKKYERFATTDCPELTLF